MYQHCLFRTLKREWTTKSLGVKRQKKKAGAWSILAKGESLGTKISHLLTLKSEPRVIENGTKGVIDLLQINPE